MVSRMLTGVLLASLCGAAAHSFPTPPLAPAKAAATSAEFQVKLHDDSQIAVTLLDPSVTVVTKYGKLVVPASEVRRIEPGFRYPAGVEGKVNKAIEDLGSPEYKVREEAEGALIGFGVSAVPGTRRALKSEDPEVARRAAAVMKNLEGKLTAEKISVRDHDVVETAEFTARGRIEESQVKVRTKHFGEAALALAEIRTFTAVGRGGTLDIALDAAQYGKMNNIVWLETNLELSDGQALEITSAGQVDLNPQQPGQFMGGPNGQILVNGNQQNFRAGQFGGVGQPGQVVGRVGQNGTPFVIGTAYKGKAGGSGKLYLRVVGSPWNSDSSGICTVKVIAGGK